MQLIRGDGFVGALLGLLFICTHTIQAYGNKMGEYELLFIRGEYDLRPFSLGPFFIKKKSFFSPFFCNVFVCL